MVTLRRVASLLAVPLVACFATLPAVAAHQAPLRPAPSQAGPGDPAQMRIAAVVNDEVISVFDVISRLRMVLLSSNIPDNSEARQKVEAQVLRALVDERLQLQEAKKQNVVASDDEVNTALGQIEKQNNMQPGQLNQFLKARGIDRSSLVNQVTASIVWAKLVRRQASQSVEISDDDVDDTLKHLKEHASEPQSHVAEIFLAVDNPSQDGEMRALAEKLAQQMRQGARFSAVAQQFSQSATAAVGGDMGWLRPDQLPAELAKAVGPLRPGELSPPIRTNNGYYLLLVLDRRTGETGGGDRGPTYDVVQVVFPLPPSASEAMKRAAAAEAMTVRGAAKSCPEMLRLGKEKAPQLSSEGKVTAAEVTPQMRGLLDKMSVGEVTQPILQRNGVGIIMLCSKQAGGGDKTAQPNRDEVFESLLRQKLDTVSRRYLRDLRRAAYVDVRI
ncbi:MAG: peptidylprolyl isomerase [Alphaproteobacteria bacterium]|nr:peptidylprolyl isomerase [Alphaproteobacteria bacterium]